MFTSLGSALSPTNIRSILGDITANQVFGKWSIVESSIKPNIIDDFSWDAIKNIILSTSAIAEFDSFASFSMSKTNSITDYPVEGGGFVSAMKVQRPGSYEVVLVKNGMNFNYAMGEFLDKLSEYRDMTKLVDIITPFKTYSGCSIEANDYAHYKDRYNNMLVVRLQIKEIVNGVVKTTGKARSHYSAPAQSMGVAKMSMLELGNLSSNIIGQI